MIMIGRLEQRGDLGLFYNQKIQDIIMLIKKRCNDQSDFMDELNFEQNFDLKWMIILMRSRLSHEVILMHLWKLL